MTGLWLKKTSLKMVMAGVLGFANFYVSASELQKQPEQPQVEQTQFQDWVMFCMPQGDKKQCRLVQSLSVKQGDKTHRLLQATLVKQGEQHLLEIVTPLGVDLRPGLIIQVDDNSSKRTPYLTCNGEGCFSVINLDNANWRMFRAGKMAKVAFKGVGQSDNTVLQLSLKGFTAASNALLKRP